MPQTLRGRPHAIPDTARPLLELLHRDHTTAEIAAKLGVSDQTVRDACKRFGLPLRDQLDVQILKNRRAWAQQYRILP